MKTPIHFCSLFGVHFDFDLIPHFIDHYTRYGFDSYKVFLHCKENYKREESEELFKSGGFEVEHVDGDRPFREGNLRVQCLTPWQQSLPKNDYCVIADSDEFHDFGTEYADVIREHDTIEGSLLDCWGDTLKDANPFINLSSQYPYRGRFVKVLTQNLGIDCIALTGYKFMAHRAGIVVGHLGSHRSSSPLKDRKRLKGRNVYHYTWRSSILMRMLDKYYFSPTLCWYVGEHFKVAANDPRMVEIARQGEEDIKDKGWEPTTHTKEAY